MFELLSKVRLFSELDEAALSALQAALQAAAFGAVSLLHRKA